MSKKMKLNLEDLKVESFVTEFDADKVKGGLCPPTDPRSCTGMKTCPNWTPPLVCMHCYD